MSSEVPPSPNLPTSNVSNVRSQRASAAMYLLNWNAQAEAIRQDNGALFAVVDDQVTRQVGGAVEHASPEVRELYFWADLLVPRPRRERPPFRTADDFAELSTVAASIINDRGLPTVHDLELVDPTIPAPDISALAPAKAAVNEQPGATL